MPQHHLLGFEPNEGAWQFLRKPGRHFSVGGIGRDQTPNRERRQQLFEDQLRRMARALNTRRIPVYISTPSGKRVRLDLGCIGHAIANGVLERPEDEASGIVEWVTLR